VLRLNLTLAIIVANNRIKMPIINSEVYAQ